MKTIIIILAIIIFSAPLYAADNLTNSQISNTINYTYQQLNLGKIIEYNNSDFIVRSLTNAEKLTIVNHLGVTLNCPKIYTNWDMTKTAFKGFGAGIVVAIAWHLITK